MVLHLEQLRCFGKSFPLPTWESSLFGWHTHPFLLWPHQPLQAHFLSFCCPHNMELFIDIYSTTPYLSSTLNSFPQFMYLENSQQPSALQVRVTSCFAQPPPTPLASHHSLPGTNCICVFWALSAYMVACHNYNFVYMFLPTDVQFLITRIMMEFDSLYWVEKLRESFTKINWEPLSRAGGTHISRVLILTFQK